MHLDAAGDGLPAILRSFLAWPRPCEMVRVYSVFRQERPVLPDGDGLGLSFAKRRAGGPCQVSDWNQDTYLYC
jgi:hypothetical protein